MICTIELDGEQRTAFLRYASQHMQGQDCRSSNNGFYRLLPSGNDAEPFLRGLGIDCHAWVHEGHTFVVELKEEGLPCGDMPSYFTRLNVTGHDGDALQAFLSTALQYRTPAPPGKIWTSAASRYGRWREAGIMPAQSFEDLFLPEEDVSGRSRSQALPPFCGCARCGKEQPCACSGSQVPPGAILPLSLRDE